MGRRVQKEVYAYDGADWNLQSERLYVYDGWNLIQELDGTGAVLKYYLWGLDLSQSLQGAGAVGGLLAVIDNPSSTMYYCQYDANGNLTQLMKSSDGSIAAHYEYDPFGNLNYSSGSYANQNPFKFSTKYHDDETGLVYYGYRYYSPDLGRWINRDPIEEEGGLNLYGFVANDPIDLFDRLGLDFLYFEGSKITVYSGNGFISKDSIDCGKAGPSWNADSGGTNGRPGIPEGWYKTTGLKTLAGKEGSLAFGLRSEKSFWENGIYYQGTMAAWDKKGYGNHVGPYGAQAFYGYDPEDINDKIIGMPRNVEYKVGLEGSHGNPISYSQGYRIHPMDRTSTSGCIGIRYYDASVSFLSFINKHSGIELFVGTSLPCCKKSK